MRGERFFLIMAAVCLAIVLIGFAPVFYLRPLEIVPWDNVEAFSRHGHKLPWHLILHGFALTAWFLLLVIQPLLIAAGRVRSHQALGRLGIILAASVVGTGAYTVFYRDAYLEDEVSAAAAGNFFTLFAFAICFTIAIIQRKHPAIHKRFMLVGSMPILTPALDRWNVYPGYRELAETALGWMPIPAQVATPILGLLLLLLAVVTHDLVGEHRLQLATLSSLGIVLMLSPALGLLLVLSGGWTRIVDLFA